MPPVRRSHSWVELISCIPLLLPARTRHADLDLLPRLGPMLRGELPEVRDVLLETDIFGLKILELGAAVQADALRPFLWTVAALRHQALTVLLPPDGESRQRVSERIDYLDRLPQHGRVVHDLEGLGHIERRLDSSSRQILK